MGPVRTGAALPDVATGFHAYRLITLAGHDGPVLLECDGLKIGLSLQRYLRSKGVADAAEVPSELGDVVLGLRPDIETVSDSIDGLVQKYRAGVPPEAIKVLAKHEPSGRWGSTGWVVDGGIRVQAATEAGLREIPAWLVIPHFEDTDLEAMFMHYNLTHGTRLPLAARDAILHALARRYMRRRPDEPRDVTVFARWLSERTDLAPSIIAEVVRNDFQVRTPDKYDEAAGLLRAGRTPAEIAKMPGMPSRAAIEKQAKKLGLRGRPSATSRPARSAGGDGRGTTSGALGARVATAQDIVEARLQSVDVRATARDLEAALKSAAGGVDKAFQQIHDWVLREAEEYRIEQAKVLFAVIDRYLHIHDTLTLIRACRIYRDRFLRERDLPLLKGLVADAEAEVRSRARTASARRRRPARRAS